MDTFATEDDVRTRFEWNDTARVSSAVIARALTDAHTILIQLIDPAVTLDPAPETLALGETLLTGAYVLGTLAARDAVDQRHVALGNQRIEEGLRFENLRSAAIDAEARAWECLAPHLRGPIGRGILENHKRQIRVVLKSSSFIWREDQNMPIILDTIILDDAFVTVREQLEEVAGRDARTIVLSGMYTSGTAEELESALDALIHAASRASGVFPISIRPGRRWVRRANSTREIARPDLAAAFTLTLVAPDPLEESIVETVVIGDVSRSGDQIAVASPGNAPSPVIITLLAEGVLVQPAISDGARTMTYQGSVALGSRLVLDGLAGRAFLDGQDVTPYLDGCFPRIEPGASSLVYTGGASSAHAAKIHLVFHPKWF